MVAVEYPIKKVTLFGSRAEGTDHANSDVDLIMEFSSPISLLTLSAIKLKLEEILHVKVDIIPPSPIPSPQSQPRIHKFRHKPDSGSFLTGYGPPSPPAYPLGGE